MVKWYRKAILALLAGLVAISVSPSVLNFGHGEQEIIDQAWAGNDDEHHDNGHDGDDDDEHHDDGHHDNEHHDNGHDEHGGNRGHDGYDQDGYDRDGFNRDGFNHDGYSRKGHHRGDRSYNADHDQTKSDQNQTYKPRPVIKQY